MLASVVQKMARNQKSSGKQNLSIHYRGKRKSRDVKEPEQKKRVQSGAIIGMVRGDTSRKRPREQSEQRASNEISFPSMSRAETKAKLKESGTPLVGFSSKVSYPIGTINLNVTMGEPGKLRTIPMEFAVVKSHPPYNVILGRTGLRSLGAVASTIHSMIKFPTSNGIATMMTKRETLQECRRMEEARGPTLERRTIPPSPPMQTSEPEETTSKVRKIRYPTWVASSVLVKKPDNSWRMCIDFKDLNKACPKDLYPLPEIDWKIESLMGFKYKCFLDAYKGYHQIQMAKKDEEKSAFHTDKGIFCYTKMPFGLKNVGATYQRLVDTIFEGQMRRNLEAYVDDMVIKSKKELEMIKDVEETLFFG
ncbi:reverse transcriptase domain-containing protein [Tanacetum coccineum]